MRKPRSDASRAVSASQIAGSIAMFGFVYALPAALWLFVPGRKIRKGPDPARL